MTELARRKAEALIRKAEAEIEFLTQQTRKERAFAESAELELAEERRKEEEALTADKYHHTYLFDGDVNSANVKSCLARLTEWTRRSPGASIEIVFKSRGGSVVDGFALWDMIQSMRAKGHHFTTSTIGMAASMAGVLLQAGDVRVVGRQSWLLIHQGSFGAMGSVGEVEDTVDWVKRIQERILDIFVSRSKMSKGQLRRRWNRKDFWVSPEEAVEWGFADEIR